MKIHYIMHAPFESIGALDRWAKEKGYFLCSHKIYEGALLPNPQEVDFLISMGGPQSAVEWRDYPYLINEVALMQTLLTKGAHVLGFCLGAQLLSIACGSRVEKSHEPEIGIYPIELTEEGKKDPISSIIPDGLKVLHWHHDMIIPPKDSKVLAKSKACPYQIVRFTEKALGIQCHMEVDQKRVKDFIRNSPNDLKLKGSYVSDIEQLSSVNYDEMNRTLFKIMDALI